MPLNNRQKALIHIYKAQARLGLINYRCLLAESTHNRAVTSADPHLTQADFDAIMAALETVLWQAVDAARIPAPTGRISTRDYWRRRLLDGRGATSRHRWRIDDLWRQLCPLLPESQRTTAYLCAIASKSCRRPIVGLQDLTVADAGLLIAALKDRLSYALRPANSRS